LSGVGTAHAQSVILEGTNVVRIENLPVPDESSDVTVYDVVFVDTPGFLLYGDPPDWDFEIENNAALAMTAIIEVLNDQAPVPGGAGSSGSSQFFVGFDEENDTIVAIGGEFQTNAWGLCSSGCVGGLTAILPAVTKTWADFRPPAGGPDAPTMEVALSGTAGITISWSPSTAGFVLQETEDVGLGNWTNSASGSTNPVTLSIEGRSKFFRVSN
jgi:hypothetical protein